jgi:hypothetical protein
MFHIFKHMFSFYYITHIIDRQYVLETFTPERKNKLRLFLLKNLQVNQQVQSKGGRKMKIS